MTINESIRSQWETMKNRSFREKLSYFCTYYGLATVCIILAVAVVISLIATAVNQKESAFCGVFFGAVTGEANRSYLSDFAAEAGIDPDTYNYSIQIYPDISTDGAITEEAYYYVQSFTAQVAGNTVEAIAGNRDLFLQYSYLGYMTDLRTVLTQQELQTLSPYLYYIDGQVQKALEDAEFGEDVTGGSYPDPKAPDAMSDPIPVGIDLTAATEAFRESYMFSSEAPVIGICASSHHTDYAVAFLRFSFGLS